ncbi:hypothetical protein [Pseudomonas nabeulensis]|uniref:hypothetical protein n=1 Tax=Pseudomonas nabeulensis TaxID=2293833 RepID=UPI0010769A7B|nr:hypothetical protein [Pseudomonas nabeulensis]
MDAKNLAVLQQLRDRMSAVPDVKSVTIDPKVLLDLLTNINLRLHGEPEAPELLRHNGRKSGRTSRATLESPESSESASDKIPKGAISKPSTAGRKSSRAKAIARAQAAEDAFKASMEIRLCRECGKPTKADPEFFLNPVTCQKCKDRARDIGLGIRPRKHDDYSEITVFKGGAPGLGKRK